MSIKNKAELNRREIHRTTSKGVEWGIKIVLPSIKRLAAYSSTEEPAPVIVTSALKPLLGQGRLLLEAEM